MGLSNNSLQRTALRAAADADRSPSAPLRENAGLSRCPFPSLRSWRTRGTNRPLSGGSAPR